MAETGRVTLEEVQHVAQLANLDLDTGESLRMQMDLNAILGHIDELNELNTDGVEPMAQVSDVLNDEVSRDGQMLRPDQDVPSLDRAAVMQAAPETDGRFFKVPKVIDR